MEDVKCLNVSNENGQCTVLFQPHSVNNGKITVNVAKSIGSTFTMFVQQGFIGSNSKVQRIGKFSSSPVSVFSGISMVPKNTTAVLAYKILRDFIPDGPLKNLYLPQNMLSGDVNTGGTSQNPSIFAPMQGGSVTAVMLNSLNYSFDVSGAKIANVVGTGSNATPVRSKTLTNTSAASGGSEP